MKREILINAAQRETRVAILEDDQLVELLVDRPDNRRMVGDIYLGKVEAVIPGIQAAFLDIGTEKAAFLHASDLPREVSDDDDDEEDDVDHPDHHDEAHEAHEAEAPKAQSNGNGRGGGTGGTGGSGGSGGGGSHGNNAGGGGGERSGGKRNSRNGPPIQDVLKRGQELLVQVTKEPISTKGPRVTAQISLAGRFLVYIPDSSKVGVSRKIGSGPERQRLKELVTSLVHGKPGGIIVRTVSEDVTPEAVGRDLDVLINQWKKINKKKTFVRAPSLVHRESGLTRGLVRDLFSTKVDSLTVDSKQIHGEVVEYLKEVAPDLIPRVKLYEEKVPLFDKFEVETDIRELFKRRCDLPSGGYLIIEPTEALVSIDVNSGRYVGKKDPEKTVTKTNVEAAREIARQLRLRDVGGIVVCDFIDMDTKSSRDKVLQELRNHLARDRAKTKAFAVSDLGLVEMTRQRVRQSHYQSMTEACPTCSGTGRVFTAETIVRRVERSVRRIAVEGRRDNLLVKLHPDVALYIMEQEKDLVHKLGKGANFTLELRDDPLLRPDEFKLLVKGQGRDVTQQYAIA